MSDQPLTLSVKSNTAQHVATIELARPPHNFFDLQVLTELADQLERADADSECRAIVLCAEGTSFCTGADFSKSSGTPMSTSARTVNPLYEQAIRLFSISKPIIAAIEGPAIGGGLGLALAADFRVSCPEAKFSANFNRLGFHPGFGLSVTLPRLIGQQKAGVLFYTGKRINGDEAYEMGMVDYLVSKDMVRQVARDLANEIAASSPLAVMSTRATLRMGLIDRLRVAVAHESNQQHQHFKTADFLEGVAAMRERRAAVFTGR